MSESPTVREGLIGSEPLLTCGLLTNLNEHQRSLNRMDYGIEKLAFTIRGLRLTIHIMYCPSCGTEYTIELKYCNRCGANLSTEVAAQPEPVVVNLTKPTLIIGAVMTLLTLGGFGMVIGGAIELARNVQLGGDPVIGMVVMGMLTILTTDIFLVRQLSKIINAALSSSTQVPRKRINALANHPMAQLPQPPTSRLQGVSSVTEGTTRFFEPYRAPSAAENKAAAEKLE